MEPWATFGKRVRGARLVGKGLSRHRGAKGKIPDVSILKILGAMLDARALLNRVPFYRQRGNR